MKFQEKKNNDENKSMVLKEAVDVVMCVHNALPSVKACLKSIEENSKNTLNKLIIIDDGSNSETHDYLSNFKLNRNYVEVIRNKAAKGYTSAANQGLKASFSPYVILINSDTIVTTKWIENLFICMSSDNKTGIVGPLSNAASWQSVPHLYTRDRWEVNKLPSHLSVDYMANIIDTISSEEFISVPFINGFCMMIKQDVFRTIGYLDEVSFPIGYGEEDDFCLRALKAGIKLKIADNCYIYHEKSKSFSKERKNLLKANALKMLYKKHGENAVKKYIDEMQNNKTLMEIRKKINDAVIGYKKK